MTSYLLGRSGRRVVPSLVRGLAAWSVLSACAAVASPLTVVELYQSQGCSSCPPANANINAIADRPDILALSFGVTYWDQLGWKDTFATPANTKRQWDYAHGSLRHDEVGTPQVVINGRKDIVGSNRSELDLAIKGAMLPADAPSITLTDTTVSVGGAKAPKAAADVWLVRYDPRIVQVSIRRGENGGRTLPHKNIVRQVVRLGAWVGEAQKYDLPTSSDSNFRTAILVQGVKGGPILAALKS